MGSVFYRNPQLPSILSYRSADVRQDQHGAPVYSHSGFVSGHDFNSLH
jgi:hypothetical protein